MSRLKVPVIVIMINGNVEVAIIVQGLIGGRQKTKIVACLM